MHLDIRTSYRIELTPAEFVLVGKALAGRTLTPAERCDARELNVRLQELRAVHQQQAAAKCDAALQQARAAAQDSD